MELEEPQNPAPVADSATLDASAQQDDQDGGFPIEGDGGAMDSSSQVHVPPPPPDC